LGRSATEKNDILEHLGECGPVDTVVCVPADWWRYNPKHVEQFPGINKLCKIASRWIYLLLLFQSALQPLVGFGLL